MLTGERCHRVGVEPVLGAVGAVQGSLLGYLLLHGLAGGRGDGECLVASGLPLRQLVLGHRAERLGDGIRIDGVEVRGVEELARVVPR